MYDDGKFDFNRAEPVWISSSSPFKLLYKVLAIPATFEEPVFMNYTHI